MKHLIKHIHTLSAVSLLLIIILLGCSTKKTGWAHRTFHNMNAHYNAYFNANELVTKAIENYEEGIVDDYTMLLPVFYYTTEEGAQTVMSDMDVAIEKCEKVINRHSIEKRGEEYVKWIDDAYLLIGKANFHKREFTQAKKFFDFVSKKYKKEESRYDAMLWLARVLIEEEDYDKAERVLNLAENDNDLPEELLPEIRMIYADMYIRQKNYPLALPELRLATQTVKGKDTRIRLTYLLGQIYAKEGEYHNASMAFKEVIDMHPDYRTLFYAKIQRALAYNTDFGGPEEVRKELFKMLADEKYVEFRDQIYFALAVMEQNEGDIPETIDYLNQSIKASVNNDNQKGLSFLKLGEIYFSKQNYITSQAYYDSCITYLNPNYTDYDQIVLLANNLKDLVEQIVIIQEEDSLQMVAKMDEDARGKFIAELIQNKMEEEERARREAEIAENIANNAANAQNSPTVSPITTGANNKWYFYNAIAMTKGKSEFTRIWGSRKNEDNWRRSDKASVAPVEYDEMTTDTGDFSNDFIVDSEGDTIKVSNDWQDPSYWLKDLPLTDSALTASDDRLIEAYYKLSIIYKEQMLDLPKSIETLDTLNYRFTPHKYQVDTYYRLYRMWEELGKSALADEYKQKILDEFPDSDFAKIIRDPEYFSHQENKNAVAEAFYEKTYGYYNRGFYSQTIISCDEGITLYSQTYLLPKFKLLRALAVGKEQGKEQFIIELQKLSNEYNGEEVGTKADELLAAIAAIEKGEEVEEVEEEEEEESPYTFEPNTKHNFVVLLPTTKGNTQVLKTNIADYNLQNYRSSGLKSRNLVLKQDTQMVAIQSFNDAKLALDYKSNFDNNTGKLSYINQNNFPRFIISYNNYAVFYQRKDLEEYMKFFNKYYNNL